VDSNNHEVSCYAALSSFLLINPPSSS